jgi:BirA family biotin operon repressor/biotin-[acetyl-CoA-carboxylase] ligase
VAPRREYPFLPSTQDEALRLVREGAPEGTVVVARRQGSGRGRLDHAWASPEGGLYLSTIVREPPEAPGLFPVAVGTRLAFGLRSQLGIGCLVKWPNDLLVPGERGPPRKLAGILVDRLPSPALGTALVVGVGLNRATPRSAFPPELHERVAVLDELVGGPTDERMVESLIVGAVRSAADSLSTRVGHARLLEECRRALYGRGRRALVDGAPSGVIRELGEDGSLLLDRDGERVAVRAGDLTVLEET